MLTKKVNRYKLPPFIILCVIAIPVFVYDLSSVTVPFVLIGVLIMWTVTTLLYFLLVATLGKLIKNDFIAILINAGFAFFLNGMIFRILHWPGGTAQLISSGVLISIAIIFTITLMFKKDKTN